MDTLPPVIAIGGPTASGKSGLAVALAERLDGVIVNADASQVYRDLQILTARPSADDEKRVPHRLYGVLEPSDRCSAGRWRGMALAEIGDTLAAGKRPILVGGTGLYLRALLQGIAPVPDIPDDIRTLARARHAEVGGEAFHAALAARDPEMAARLRPQDSQRLMRAWEVMEATGRSLAEWQRLPAEAAGYRFHVVVLTPPRDELYTACNARFAEMVAAGALDEVRALMDRAEAEGLDPDLPVFKAVGYGELAAYLRGESGLDAAVAAAQQRTRRYAKRQLTWFRHQLPGTAEKDEGVTVLKYSCVDFEKIFSNIS